MEGGSAARARQQEPIDNSPAALALQHSHSWPIHSLLPLRFAATAFARRWGSDEGSTISEIAKRGVRVCPTIGAGWLTKAGLRNAISPSLERMRASGVELIAGSDAGAIPDLAFHRLADGLVCMARCAGLHHAEALRAATSGAASALGLSSTCGTLAEGLSADMIVVRGDPLDDLDTICAPPLAIVCRGVKATPCAGPEGTGRGAAPRWTMLTPLASPRGNEQTPDTPLASSARCPCIRACA